MEYGISNILMASTAKSVGQIPAHAGIPMFAPRAATKDAISSLTPSLDTSCFTLTGMVPTLDWDVNATTCAGQNPRKNRIGLNPPANRISAPSIRTSGSHRVRMTVQELPKAVSVLSHHMYLPHLRSEKVLQMVSDLLQIPLLRTSAYSLNQ